jgi:hypothetical protein
MRGCGVRLGRRCLLRWRVLVALVRVRRVRRVVPVQHVGQVLAVRMVLEPRLRLVRRALLAVLPARVAVPLALRRRAVLVARPVLLWPVRSREEVLVLVSRTARRVRPPAPLLRGVLF